MQSIEIFKINVHSTIVQGLILLMFLFCDATHTPLSSFCKGYPGHEGGIRGSSGLQRQKK